MSDGQMQWTVILFQNLKQDWRRYSYEWRQTLGKATNEHNTEKSPTVGGTDACSCGNSRSYGWRRDQWME
jgi:hypothetical protein